MKQSICFILTTVLLVFVLQGNAQSKQIGKGSIGIQGGVNFQSINGKDINGKQLNSDILTGYHLGFNADLKIAPGLFFQTGLNYITKGGKNYLIQSYPSVASSIKLTYLELPLRFVYKPILGKGHLLIGAGSYVSYGLAGKAKFTLEGIEMKKDISFQNKVTGQDVQNEVYFRRMDAGLSMMAGYECSNRLFFQLDTQLGLARINPQFTVRQNDPSLAQHTGFGLSVGYRL